MGRFLNADAYAYTGQGFVGYNMFAYCINNPVLLTDDSGTSAAIALQPGLGAIASALLKSAASALSTVSPVAALVIVGVAVVAAVVVNAVTNGTSSQSTAASPSSTYNSGNSSTKSNSSQAGVASGGSAAPLPPNDPNKNNNSGVQYDLEELSKISTGRTTPQNLQEKIAMDSAKSNPTEGKLIKRHLNDKRIPDGFSKFSRHFETSIGDIEIHYVGNAELGIFFDYKFK
jgi:hypothetical protein